MTKINPEQAELEVQSWLANKKIADSRKQKNKDNIEVIVEAIVNGVLVLNPETFEFVHTLLFPIGEKNEITTLTYRARMNDKDKASYMKGVSSADFEEYYNAHLAALTKTARGIIALLDSEDKRIASAIGVFFT